VAMRLRAITSLKREFFMYLWNPARRCSSALKWSTSFC
jgi:hypothetical protein